jgi:hypothetical protein
VRIIAGTADRRRHEGDLFRRDTISAVAAGYRWRERRAPGRVQQRRFLLGERVVLAGGRAKLQPALQRETLEVSNQGGTTQVTAMQSSSQISVVERPTGDATSDHNVAGSAGTVSSHRPGGISIRDCHMDYQITMPPSVALNVRGDVGLVRLQGALAKAQIQTDAGEVSGTGLGRGSYTVTTDAGRVKLTFTSAPTLVKVTTSVGAIDAMPAALRRNG